MNLNEGLLCLRHCKWRGGFDHKPARCGLWPPALTGWYRRQKLSVSALGKGKVVNMEGFPVNYGVT